MTSTVTDDKEIQLKIEKYGDMLFKFSYIRLQNIQDAEDVVQEVFYQYLKTSHIFESPEHEKAWLLKVAVNACRKLWRSAWRRHQAALDPEEEWAVSEGGGLPKSFGSGQEPEEAVVRQEERRRLMEKVLQLPARYREVIHLFYYEDLSVKEIARITGRGESTVTSQLTRGRELLRRTLKEEYDFG